MKFQYSRKNKKEKKKELGYLLFFHFEKKQYRKYSHLLNDFAHLAINSKNVTFLIECTACPCSISFVNIYVCVKRDHEISRITYSQILTNILNNIEHPLRKQQKNASVSANSKTNFFKKIKRLIIKEKEKKQ